MRDEYQKCNGTLKKIKIKIIKLSSGAKRTREEARNLRSIRRAFVCSAVARGI